MTKTKLTAQQVLALQVSERTMSVLSIVGSLFIMITFIRWHYFRKPINRLVFYASFGNVMANVATLISTSALPAANQPPSPLCEFQGTLIQWFMMADSLWVFCMALNVMLVFFYQYNSRQLRHLEKYYLGFSYGLPFMPAIIYIINDHTNPERRIIGGATIWCWVTPRLQWMRIAFFYAPVWIVVTCTLGIYIVTGHTIFSRRKHLRAFSRRNTNLPPVITNPFTAANLNAIERKTEISVRYTTDTVDSDSTAISQACGDESRSSFSSTRKLSNIQAPVITTSHGTTPHPNQTDWKNPACGTAETSFQHDDDLNSRYRAAISADHRISHIEGPRSMSVSTSVPTARRAVAMEGNTAAWSYFKVAFLMFAALFIVWVPSTVNRLQQFISPDKPIFGLNLASALVLPLQGFWNSMVYISTTWPECKRAIREILDALASAKHQTRPHRQDSEHTLTTDVPDFDTDVPLSDMLEHGPPPPRPQLHSRLSSTESIKKPPQAHQYDQ